MQSAPPETARPLRNPSRERSVEQDLATEWLEADGVGGYASSTVALVPTRRYHGLLVTPPPGTVKRHVFLVRFVETLDGARVEPAQLEDFEPSPHPTWTYANGLVREVQLVRGQPTVLTRYSVEGATVELSLAPVLAFREADALTFENDALDGEARPLSNGIRLAPYESLPALSVTTSCRAPFENDPRWTKGVELPVDEARGYDHVEDSFVPGRFRVRLAPGEEVVVAATIGEPVVDPSALWEETTQRRTAALELVDPDLPDPVQRLAHGADDFLYRDAGGRTGIIAGFPWFLEWGRDTFISLPGLTLARGHVEHCGEVLSGAVRFLRDGLLPNIFGLSRATSHYGSVDASLWFARAVRLYIQAGGDRARVYEELYPALREIAWSYHAGTGLGIRTDNAGLLRVGSPDLNPTWMDARTSHGPVTPRHGYPVEIEALWLSLLATLVELSERVAPRDRAGFALLADRAAKSFLDRFWLPGVRSLADVWREDFVDASLRPNAVIAASLDASPLTAEMRRGVVAWMRRELLTPVGLRTLAPGHHDYRGTYAGDQEQRDAAYHQGTVWPWLLGAYVEATLRAHPGSQSHIEHLRECLGEVLHELDRAGLGHVSEVFDGDPPHKPGGSIAQAWNTAELLRAYALLDAADRGEVLG